MVTRSRDQVRRAYNDRVAELHARKDLTEDGKRGHLAAALQDAREEMAAISQSEQDDRIADRDRLLKQLFGNPQTDSTSIVSYRDALDRAEQLQRPEEALALLERADTTGDEPLARAICMVASRKGGFGNVTGWSKVLDAWGESRPEMAQALEQLAELDDHQTPEARLSRSMANSLNVPRELGKSTTSLELSRLRCQVQ